MADSKITALTALTAADPANDMFPVVDVSDTTMAASGTTKRISINNILACSPSATLASATITGDLTVDTSTLKVDSTNDRVGIGTASPAAGAKLGVLGATSVSTSDYIGSSTYAARFIGSSNGASSGISLLTNSAAGQPTPASIHATPIADFRSALTATYSADNTGAGYFAVNRFNPSGSNTLEHYKIDNAGVATWSNVGGVAGTAMTLNSTGLGVGGSPDTGLFTVGSTGITSATTPSMRILSNKATFVVTSDGATNGAGTTINYSWANGGQGPLTFRNAAIANVMTLDSSGNVGVGVTPSAWGSGLKALQVGARGYGSFFDFNNDVVGLTSNLFWTGSAYSRISTSSKYAVAYYHDIGSGAHQWLTSSAAGTNGVTPTMNTNMTLDGSGNLLLGTTSAVASGSTFQNLGAARQVLTLKGNDATSYTLGLWSATTTGDNFFAYFGTEASTTVRGSVTYNRAGGLVAYNTTSDYRAKDIIGPVSNSGSLIDLLKVYVGKMKGATIERPMLIAHEAQEVAPYAVTGTKDEVDAEGNAKYQQMDVSSFIPLLIAEIQSLRTRVQTLEAR
jgi:hypothetical protein